MWRHCDLHNHTTPNEQCSDDWDPDRFVSSCVETGLDVVAITDHDHCNHILDAVAAAQGTELTVIAGVELSTDVGHILALAPDDGGAAVIDDFCKRLGVIPGGEIKFDAVVGAYGARRSAETLFSDEVVLVAAHVDSPASLLSSPNPRSRDTQLESAARVHALEVSSTERLNEWSRDGVKQSERKFTLLQGSDTHDPDSRIARSSWIYLPEVTAHGLRHALAVPEASVVVADHKPDDPQWTIEYLEFEGGHHSGERFQFSERANAIIGPPNAGKSLLVDAFKFVFGVECDIEEVERVTQARMGRTMPKGTVVRVGLRTSAGFTVVERTVGGADRPTVPFCPIIFSQTELTRRSIAAEPAIQLLDLHCPGIDDIKHSVQARADEVATIFEQLCESAEQCRTLRDSVENPEDGLAATQKAIRDLSGHESLATSSMNLEKVAGWQGEITRLIDDWFEGATADALSVPDPPELTNAPAELAALMPATDLRSAARDALSILEEAIRAARRPIDEIMSPAQAELAAQQEAADDELEQHGFERGSELLETLRRLQSRLRRLQHDKSTLEAHETAVNDGLVALRIALAEVEKARTSLSDIRRSGCKRVNESMHSFFARVDPAGASSLLEMLFDDLKIGTKMHPGTRKRALDSLDRMRFMEWAVREIQGHPLEAEDRYVEQDRVVSEALERDKHQQIPILACCYPGDSLDLLWKEEKPPRPFEDLTEGLRALAIKEISFAASDLPVISDQPEDAVPTRSVFTSLVPTLREQRRSRQFVVVSHDANIVVTSDVETILVLDANEDGSHARGGLFDPTIQAAALEHLEGGRQAFLLRSDRYGKSTP